MNQTRAQTLELVPLTSEIASRIEAWLDDDATQAFLGDRQWIHDELRLEETQPGTVVGDSLVIDRCSWVAQLAGADTGVAVAEIYEDGSAAVVVLVAPALRDRGFGRAVMTAVGESLKADGVERLVGSIAPSNVPAYRAAMAAGFSIADEPDEQGMLAVELRFR